MSTLRLFGDNVNYQKIADEISAVEGVISHGLVLGAVRAAVIADGPEAKIIEKVQAPPCLYQALSHYKWRKRGSIYKAFTAMS